MSTWNRKIPPNSSFNSQQNISYTSFRSYHTINYGLPESVATFYNYARIGGLALAPIRECVTNITPGGNVAINIGHQSYHTGITLNNAAQHGEQEINNQHHIGYKTEDGGHILYFTLAQVRRVRTVIMNHRGPGHIMLCAVRDGLGAMYQSLNHALQDEPEILPEDGPQGGGNPQVVNPPVGGPGNPPGGGAQRGGGPQGGVPPDDGPGNPPGGCAQGGGGPQGGVPPGGRPQRGGDPQGGNPPGDGPEGIRSKRRRRQ